MLEKPGLQAPVYDHATPYNAAGPDVHPYTTNMDQVPEERKKLVQQIISDVVYARDVYFKSEFKQMRDDMQFAFDGADPEWIENSCYVANISKKRHSFMRKIQL